MKINQLNVKYLKAKSIDGVDVNDLFTTNTDQTVDSVIHFQGVNIAKSFNCNKINGLDLSNDVVTFTPDDVIVIKGKNDLQWVLFLFYIIYFRSCEYYKF